MREGRRCEGRRGDAARGRTRGSVVAVSERRWDVMAGVRPSYSYRREVG